jgi:hydroxyacylglutathione hydrolase
VLPYDRDIYLIVAETENVSRIADDLSLIGIDRVAGAYILRSPADLQAEGIETLSIAQMSVETLAERGSGDGLVVLDVRNSDEWNSGHMPGAVHIPVGALQARSSELPSGRQIAVHCQKGERSAIAASILQNKGFEVVNVVGGFGDWERSGGRVESDDGR